MTYRGIYRDGVVRLQGEVDLRNGSEVEVHSIRASRESKLRAGSRRSKPSRKRPVGEWERAMAKAKKMTKKERHAAIMAACGAWKHRPEWEGKSSAQIARELRKRAASRGLDG